MREFIFQTKTGSISSSKRGQSGSPPKAGSIHDFSNKMSLTNSQEEFKLNKRQSKRSMHGSIKNTEGTPTRSPNDLSQTEMLGIIKRLNKPEMLLLNHLQNQIKYYYPQKMNKYLTIEDKKLSESTNQRKVTDPITTSRSSFG